MSEEFVEVKIQLPSHLAKFLNTISNNLALTPSQFITKLLEMYCNIALAYYQERKRE